MGVSGKRGSGRATGPDLNYSTRAMGFGMTHQARSRNVKSGRIGQKGFVVGILVILAGSVAGYAGEEDVVINEIMYHPPEDCARAEFIELYNRGDEPVNIGGWFLNGGVRFTFPEGLILEPGAYGVVVEDEAEFRSAYGSVNALMIGPYERSLSNRGEWIELLNRAKEVVDIVRWEQTVPWPVQADGLGSSLELIHPALDNAEAGAWRASLGSVNQIQNPAYRFENAVSTATPGRRNSTYTERIPPYIFYPVRHAPQSPTSADEIVVTAKVIHPHPGTGLEVTLAWQAVLPGHYIRLSDPEYRTDWVTAAMRDDGAGPDATAGDSIYTGVIPAQGHRTLVRYKIQAAGGNGASAVAPYPEDPEPNFACYVYDGVPPYRVTQPVIREHTVLEKVPVYHLIARAEDVRACEMIPISNRAERREFRWYGTFVYNGEVYDHIRFRLRGGVWRYSFNKRMWKLRMNKGHYFEGHFNDGTPYPVARRTINLNSLSQNMMIDVPHRGELGLFEATAFWLFRMAGCPSPHTTWVHFRIVDEVSEEGPDQFKGDFYGLFLDVEAPDERFLEAHGYNPNSNLYKMNNGWTADGKKWEKETNNCDPADDSDIRVFYDGYNRQGIRYLEQTLDLDEYLSYRTILEAVHHYDVYAEKNYYYFNNADTGLWEVMPWDLDLTFGSDHGNGREPFRDMVVGDISARFPKDGKYALEYRNRMREIMQLLYNEEVLFPQLDEWQSLIAEIAAADLDRWDLFQPADASPSKSRYKPLDVRLTEMKEWIIRRINTTYNDQGNDGSHYVRAMKEMAHDPDIPDTPVLQVPAEGLKAVSHRPMELTASEFRDPNGDFHRASRWILTQISGWEIQPDWDSGITQQHRTKITIDPRNLMPGRVYRARVKYQDTTGRWSLWSEPVTVTVETGVGVEDWVAY